MDDARVSLLSLDKPGSRPLPAFQPRAPQKHKSIVGGDRLCWRRDGSALALYHGKSQNTLVHIEPDPIWPGMFRVRSRVAVSDLCNLTRAKDAAFAIALRHLNSEVQEKRSDGTHIRARRSGVAFPPQPSDHPRTPARPKGPAFGSSQ